MLCERALRDNSKHGTNHGQLYQDCCGRVEGVEEKSCRLIVSLRRGEFPDKHLNYKVFVFPRALPSLSTSISRQLTTHRISIMRYISTPCGICHFEFQAGEMVVVSK